MWDEIRFAMLSAKASSLQSIGHRMQPKNLRSARPVFLSCFAFSAYLGGLRELPAQEPSAATPTVAADSLNATAREATRERSLGINYEYAHLTQGFSPWQLLTLDAKGPVGGSVLIGRLYAARRFGQSGMQAELEAYPRISSSNYLYLNAARRLGENVFIRTRGAAELYHHASGGWEGSLGGRYFDREQDHDLFGVTGTLGKYVGNYWHSLRPTVMFTDRKPSRSIALTTRRYFSHRYDYVGLRMSAGSGPDVTRDDVTRLGGEGLRTYSALLDRKQALLNTPYRVNYGVGFEREEYRRDAAGKPVAREHIIVRVGGEILLR